MTAGQLADSLGVSYGEIVKKLVMLGYMVSATQSLERDVIEILADDSGFILKDQVTEDITKFEEIDAQEIDEVKSVLTADVANNIAVEVPKIRDFGDYSTNVAMLLAKPMHKAPRDIAQLVSEKIMELPFVESVNVAGPGFINFSLSDKCLIDYINQIIFFKENLCCRQFL